LGFREDFEFLGRLSKHVKLNTAVIDTGIRRCYSHTLYEVRKQQLWYGRTAKRYYKVAGINFFATLIRSNAVLGLIIITVIMAPVIGLLSLVFLSLAMTLIYVRWLRRDVRILGARSIPGRLMWYLFREVYGRLFFDIGFILSFRSTTVGR